MPLIRKTATPAPVEQGDAFALLARGTADERWRAARGLATLPGGVAALGQALAGEADARVREAIFTALAQAGTPESAEVVLPHLRSDDANLRTGALDALRVMPRAVLARLPDLLADPDPDVRLLSCEIARALPSATATPLLCEVLERDVECNVCAAAVDVLAEIGGPEALAALQRCAERFAHEAFLAFAIRAAARQISAQSGPKAGDPADGPSG